MTSRQLIAIALIFGGFLGGCAHQRQAERYWPMLPEESGEIRQPETPPVVPLNPRRIQAELWISISDIHILKGRALRSDNLRRGIPPETSPQLHVWSSGIIPRPSQHVLDLKLDGPLPRDIFADKENGNRIIYWNLSPILGKKDSIVIRRRVTIESYEILAVFDTTTISSYDSSGRIFQFYTKSEPFLKLTSEIRTKAAQIVGNETNPFSKARKIFDWVNRNMVYDYPPPQRGAQAALQLLKGDCGQYADLFVALCRAAGIPARFVSGFQANKKPQLGYHAWAEFYLPAIGWVPADATHEGRTQFARLNSRRLISSVGSNIPLKHVPKWATYANSDLENGRTDFMQVATVAYAGIRAKINAGIRTLSFEKEENGPMPVPH